MATKKKKINFNTLRKSELEDLIALANGYRHRTPRHEGIVASGMCCICDLPVPKHVENEYYNNERCRKIAKAWFTFEERKNVPQP